MTIKIDENLEKSLNDYGLEKLEFGPNFFKITIIFFAIFTLILFV